ncbi:hypothetical protein CBOM_07734 [Ceraceosorus bombacis]|uniref:Uncharacterized protein n=1 Tax=Ceraceosorus bombacis TaxID=401625 RepID=A0A0P1BHQ4_9BASI|nr:hypothetical protein CBOM_07734 [Ceraceosorus bombacis]
MRSTVFSELPNCCFVLCLDAGALDMRWRTYRHDEAAEQARIESARRQRSQAKRGKSRERAAPDCRQFREVMRSRVVDESYELPAAVYR